MVDAKYETIIRGYDSEERAGRLLKRQRLFTVEGAGIMVIVGR